MLSCALNYELNCIKTLQSHGEYFKSVCVVRFPSTCGYLMFNTIGLSSKVCQLSRMEGKAELFEFCIYHLLSVYIV